MSEEKEKKVEYVPFIGTVEDYLSRSPWDYYSWGHIDFGIASFLLLSLLITITEALIGPAIIDWWLLMIFVLIVGVVWELLENTIIYWWGWRPLNRRDSWINAIWDIIFVCIGGAVMWLLKWILMDVFSVRGTWFYVGGLISFIIILIGYFIGFYITNKMTKQSRSERKKLIS